MNAQEVIAALDALAVTAEKFAEAEPAFVAQLAATVAAVKALLPSGTVQGIVAGVKADWVKFTGLFQKK